MAFNNTQQSFSTSGGGSIFLAALPATNSIKNSGGQVVIAGPVIINDVYFITVSGSIASYSGNRYSVIAGNSGAILATSGDVIYFVDATGQSGLTGGATTELKTIRGSNFYAPSGVTTINSGVSPFQLVVTYQTQR